MHNSFLARQANRHRVCRCRWSINHVFGCGVSVSICCDRLPKDQHILKDHTEEIQLKFPPGDRHIFIRYENTSEGVEIYNIIHRQVGPSSHLSLSRVAVDLLCKINFATVSQVSICYYLANTALSVLPSVLLIFYHGRRVESSHLFITNDRQLFFFIFLNRASFEFRLNQ